MSLVVTRDDLVPPSSEEGRHGNTNRVLDVAVDSRTGAVWAATAGGLVHWMPETGVSQRVTLVSLAHIAVDINGGVWISRDQRAAIGGLSLIAADGSLTTDGDGAVWSTETVNPSV